MLDQLVISTFALARTSSSMKALCWYLLGDMQNGEVGEAAQGNGLLDDAEGCTDHGLTGHTCRSSGKHKCELHSTIQFCRFAHSLYRRQAPLLYAAHSQCQGSRHLETFHAMANNI